MCNAKIRFGLELAVCVIGCEVETNSGAAITGSGDFNEVIFGLHSTSRITENGNKYNVGVLITEDVYDDIESWSE